ncbi:MAG: PD-(D/E)XK nuclease family protein [Clostridia bacterium]|nr:PD-(D/E)XK nuclease family protein [Clostridia bacterium]
MLHLLTGTVGSGKTAQMHKLIRELAQNGRDGIYLLVPEQFTHESDVGLVRTAGPAVAGTVEVLSFERLADRIFNKYGRPCAPFLGSCGKAVFMANALDELSDKLLTYRRHADKPAFISNMLDITDELKKCSVTPQQLTEAAACADNGLLRQKAREIALIYETYDAMTAERFSDSSDRLELLCDILDRQQCMRSKTVFLDGFRRFTGQEYKVLERILTQADEVYAAFCCDKTDIADEEANQFTSIKMTVKRLCDTAKRCMVKIAAPVKITDESSGFKTYAADELKYLEYALYKHDADAYTLSAPAVTVCAARDVTDECEWTARTIKRLMRTENIRCRDISVIYRSDGIYERELKYAMKKYGVPMFEDERQPVTNQPLVCLIRNALSAASNGFSTDALMHMAKTSLTGLSVEQWSQLENYVFMWDINGVEWLRQWEYNPDGYGEKMTDERREMLCKINESRKMLTEPVLSLKEKCTDATGKEICAAIYEFLIENGCDRALAALAADFESRGESALALEQQQVWDMLTDTLDQLACAMGDKPVTLKKFASLFEIALSSQTLGRIPTGFDEVSTGAATRIQRRMSEIVFAVGMNEGVFPLPPSSGGIFTDAERLELERKSLEMAKNSRTHALDEKFIVYNTVCSARKKLFVSYATTDSAAAVLAKSETVRRIEELFPLANRITTSAQGTELIESEESAFELMSSLWNEKSDLSESLKAYFSEREDYKGKLDAIRRAADSKPFSMKKEQALKLFREHIYITPSRAEVFEQCPFRFFCQYGLHAMTRKKAALDAAQSGSIIHSVLENMLKKYRANDLSSMDDALIKDEIHNLTVEYADELLGGYAVLPQRMIYLLTRIEKAVGVIISRLGEEFSQSSFTPFDFELPIGREGRVREFRIELENGGSISIYGTVDRVDLMRRDGKAYIRVVDYKSGTKEFHLSDVLNGMNMQMMMYLIALWQNGSGHYGGEIVPCGVFYLPARFMPFNAERTQDGQALLDEVLAAGKMNGLVLDDPESIEGMTAGGFNFIPVKQNKDGTLRGNMIDIVSMTRLKNKIADILTDLAEKLQSGYIPAKPVQGKGFDNTCEYCDYKSVCCHESSGDYRYITFDTHTDCIEKMKEDEQDGTQLDT